MDIVSVVLPSFSQVVSWFALVGLAIIICAYAEHTRKG